MNNLHYTPDQIKFILDFLELYKKPNTSGNIVICSPLREDRNPSFSIHASTGLWVDFGTGEKGNILTLLAKMKGVDHHNAQKHLKRVLEYHEPGVEILTMTIPKSGDQTSDDDYWSDFISPSDVESDKPSRIEKIPDKASQEDLSGYHRETATERLQQCQSELLDEIRHYDLLTKETLIKYSCGLLTLYNHEWLTIPYSDHSKLCGVQLYRRENGSKSIRMLKGSKPSGTFFGMNHIKGKGTLFIAKSPREAMLLNQGFGEYIDAIGIASGETGKISDEQKRLLKGLKGTYCSVKILFDCDTEMAQSITREFTDNIYGAMR